MRRAQVIGQLPDPQHYVVLVLMTGGGGYPASESLALLGRAVRIMQARAPVRRLDADAFVFVAGLLLDHSGVPRFCKAFICIKCE